MNTTLRNDQGVIDKREDRIRGMFSEIAPRYDLLNHLLSLNIDHYWRWRTTKLVPPKNGSPILDMCTGTGDLALAYDRAAQGKVPIIGADFCPQMLELAVVKARKKNVDRVSFVEADAQHLPFPDAHFQIATVAFGLRNVTDTDRGIAEMVRVTEPGGTVAILEFSKPKNWLFKRIFAFYFRWMLPVIGQVISGSRSSAYKYLPESVQEFDDGEALAQRLRRHGLKDVRWHSLTFGVASLYVGTK